MPYLCLLPLRALGIHGHPSQTFNKSEIDENPTIPANLRIHGFTGPGGGAPGRRLGGRAAGGRATQGEAAHHGGGAVAARRSGGQRRRGFERATLSSVHQPNSRIFLLCDSLLLLDEFGVALGVCYSNSESVEEAVKRSMGAIKFVLRERSKIKKAIEAEGGTGLADTKPPTL